ncbi:Optic atrophy 3-like [Trypanosoma melophagium]|uniref:Optic atrophy 3-like n=1 Tax=Trypanosoma melophagium TaxID=715481 RepID=UPI00351A9891|nr:Optic atrophy 3-like [Trypanosoma melophagium]
MAPLPAIRLFLLAVRQISKPVVKATVTRAQNKATLTRALCIGLGRFSLGISRVVGKWAAEERVNRRVGTNSYGNSDTTNTGSSTESGETTANGKDITTENLVVAPRSRSLLRATSEDTMRSSRLFFVRRPVESAWQAFRTAFFAPCDENVLVNTGAELLIELIVYSILVVVVYFELRTSAISAEAKEKYLLGRIEALERKVNELIEEHHRDEVDTIEVPEHVRVTRLDRIKKGFTSVLNKISLSQ